MAPTVKNYPDPNVKSAKIEKPRGTEQAGSSGDRHTDLWRSGAPGPLHPSWEVQVKAIANWVLIVADPPSISEPICPKGL